VSQWYAARTAFRAPAFLAITRHGAQIAAAARRAVAPTAPLYLPAKYGDALPNEPVTLYTEKSGALLARLWPEHDALVAVVSIGALVRLIAPLLASKEHDPAVLAIDDAGRFVIPILSGHLGGANSLAQQVAGALSAIPILTTASDSQKSLAVDLLGSELSWSFRASHEALVNSAAAVVNGEPVLLWQSADGEADWWTNHAGGRAGVPLPTHLTWRQEPPEVLPNPEELAGYRALLWVARTPPPEAVATTFVDRLVWYVPPERFHLQRVSIGIGCDRGTPASTISAAVSKALACYQESLPHFVGTDPPAVAHIASITLKHDEAGLWEAITPLLARGALLSFYPAEALAAIPVPCPSETVRRYTGTPSVAEAAALLAAGWNRQRLAEYPGFPMLRVAKERVRGADGKNATVAVAACYQPPLETLKPSGV